MFNCQRVNHQNAARQVIVWNLNAMCWRLSRVETDFRKGSSRLICWIKRQTHSSTVHSWKNNRCNSRQIIQWIGLVGEIYRIYRKGWLLQTKYGVIPVNGPFNHSILLWSPKLLQIWPRKMGQDLSLTDSSLICTAGWFGIAVLFHKFPQGDSESLPEKRIPKSPNHQLRLLGCWVENCKNVPTAEVATSRNCQAGTPINTTGGHSCHRQTQQPRTNRNCTNTRIWNIKLNN